MEQINLYDLIKFYGRKWRVIVVLTLAGLVAGLVYNTFIQVPMYQSNSKLILVTAPTSASTGNQTLINNYIDLITSRRVLEPIIEKQDKTLTYEKLLSEVKAVNQKDTAVIDVTVTTNNAKQSAGIANEITTSFKKAVDSLYQTSGVIVIDPAVASQDPKNVHSTLQLATSTGLGLVLSLITLFFIYDYTGGKTKKKDVKNKTILRKVSARFIPTMAKKTPTKKLVNKVISQKVIPKASNVTTKKNQTTQKNKIATTKSKKS